MNEHRAHNQKGCIVSIHNRFGNLDPSDPEFSSIEEFVEYLVDDERTTYSCQELQCLCYSLSMSTRPIKEMLSDWGLTLAGRAKAKRVRGLNTNSHDRWYGPGSSPTHGGSGWEQINGFAGQKG